MNNFLVHDETTRAQMVGQIDGIDCVEDLFSVIPQAARTGELNFEPALSELEVQKRIKSLAAKNKINYASFLGGGIYNKFVPACIGQVAQRFEFLTAYTPYQPEISQGSLQIMYEFQTMMCRLTGMDVCNATVYDGATACAEALLMAVRVKKLDKVLVANSLNPEYKKVVETYMWANDIGVKWFDEIPSNSAEFACVLVQTPDFYGEIVEAPAVDTILIVCTDPSTLAILEPCGENALSAPAAGAADIIVGDVQTLGLPMSFGGPSAGFIACREKYMRQIPGRLAGRTVDAKGEQAFCLTIQTREQHIKREKATSNICSNQALMGLCATLYLSVMGEDGFKQASYLSAKYAHKLADGLKAKGVKVLNKNFFNEFTIEVEDADKFLANLKKHNIIGGLKLDDKKVIVAATEMNSEEEIKVYIDKV